MSYLAELTQKTYFYCTELYLCAPFSLVHLCNRQCVTVGKRSRALVFNTDSVEEPVPRLFQAGQNPVTCPWKKILVSGEKVKLKCGRQACKLMGSP